MARTTWKAPETTPDVNFSELEDLIAMAKAAEDFPADQKVWLTRFEDIIAKAKTGKDPRALFAQVEDLMLQLQMQNKEMIFEEARSPIFKRLSTNPVRNVYQLKVTLMGSRPPIWRRILVPGYVTLATLHDILQETMGWYDCHMHDFSCKGIRFALPSEYDGDFGGFSAEDERKVRLNEVLTRPRSSMRYQYDFGDSWDHKIVVEKILDTDPRCDGRAICLIGKLNCPPEDCGGIWGYYELLETLRTPSHPNHAQMSEWAGPVDPEDFNVDSINSRLAAIRIPDPGKRGKAASAP
jgi:hypothetical protein